MNPVEIKVLLHTTGEEENDTLSFFIDEDSPVDVNLNDQNSQNSLKEAFIQLLKKIINEEIFLTLSIDSEYTKGLFKDVCREYIEDLNKEIKDVRQTILSQR